MKAKLFSSSTLLVLLSIVFTQCTDPHARYEDPPWLGGTNIETLEQEGKYSIFLDLMDMAEYRTSIENQLFTLFVPSDSAFEEYFKSVGIASVDDIDKRTAEEIFGLHILINPRSREQLMFEYAWGELQDPRGEYGTLFHRKETYSYPQDYIEEVRYNEDYLGEELQITRGRILIPLWTSEYFEDYDGDPEGSDYLYMYPESEWSGTQWHDAMVTEAEVRTSSGFIYYLDKVVAPPPSIEVYLKNNQDEFGLFYDILQRFASYANAGLDEWDVRHYRKSYNQVLNICTPSKSGFPANMLYMWTAMVPNDAALQEFLDRTVLAHNDSITAVPELFLVYLINSQLNNRLVLPSTIERSYLNYFGDAITVDINTDIYKTFMTSNGPVYALNKYLEPNAFTCVPGPLFYDNDYSVFLYALNNANLLSTITKPDIDVTLFAATNDELLDYGIRANVSTDNVAIEIKASDDTWKQLEGDFLDDFVQDFIHYGRVEDFSGEGFLRMASDNYIYYNGGSVYGGGNFKDIDPDPAAITETLPSDLNGNLFILDNAIKEPYNVAEFILSDPDLSDFGDLLQLAGMIDSIQEPHEQDGVQYPRVIGLNALHQWTIFAPTNAAIADADAAGLIPYDLAEPADTLKNFIHYHFIREKSIFDDGKFSGTALAQSYTPANSGPVYKTLEITNSVHNLSVEDLTGQTVAVDHADANFLVEDGVLHKINSVLLQE